MLDDDADTVDARQAVIFNTLIDILLLVVEDESLKGPKNCLSTYRLHSTGTVPGIDYYFNRNYTFQGLSDKKSRRLGPDISPRATTPSAARMHTNSQLLQQQQNNRVDNGGNSTVIGGG